MSSSFALRDHRLTASRSRTRTASCVPHSIPTPVVTMKSPLAQRGNCACGGICPRCNGENARAPRHDFSDVRVHPAAPGITGPLRARAATIGRDIYFHPGQYQPGTPRGDALIAHEFAHTMQTRGHGGGGASTGELSAPGDALEKNAEALAAGETTHALAAPPGAVLRSPFDSESTTDRDRRQALLRSINNALGTVLSLLSTGGLLQGVEVPVERNGIRGVAVNAGTAEEMFVSYAQRDKILRRIVGALQAMGSQYRTAPIPPDFTTPIPDQSGRFTSTVEYRNTESPDPVTAEFSRLTPEWADLQGAYYRQLVAQGLLESGPEQHLLDGYYLDPSAIVTPGAAQGARRASRGNESGAYVVFPDIDREPLHYRHQDRFSAPPRGSVIIELWHDDFGYYYEHKGQRIYVANPWGSSRK